MRARFLVAGTLFLAVGFAARGACEDCSQPGTPSRYHAEAGDRADKQMLEASRSFSGGSQLAIDVCAGELHLKGTRSSAIRLEVAAKNASEDLSRYVHDFSVQGGAAKIDLRVPKSAHPVITIYLPEGSGLESQVNLGAGDLFFSADRLAGERELNLGAGKVVLYLSGDRDYQNLEANVGMGSFHDNRPGGGSAHFIVARSMEGSGKGDLKINVGAGEIELDPAK